MRERPLPYAGRLESRSTDGISLVVIHCTELPDLATARIWGEKVVHLNSETGNSGHFYIDRDGSIEKWVPLDRVAHHVRGHNPESIGIELVNRGRYPHWFRSDHQQLTESYPDVQIGALATLLNDLAAQLPGLQQLAGHADLDTDLQPAQDNPEIMIRRKLDPGPLFPWSRLLSEVPLNRLSQNEKLGPYENQ